MNDEPDQEALFYIEGPDERGCVWMHGTNSRDPWARNLGPCRKVAEVLSHWLETVDFDEASGEAGTPEGHALEDADAPPVVKLVTGLTGED